MIPGWDMIIIGMNPYSIFEGEGFRTRSGHLLKCILSLKERGRLYYAYPDGGGYRVLDRGGGLYLVDLTSCSLSLLIEREGLKEVIFWLYHPLLLHHIPKEKGILIFDAVDDLREHPSFSSSRREIERSYEEIQKRAQVIFTVSKELAQYFSYGRERVYAIRNGVPESFLHFRAKPLQEIENLPTPILGYVGIMEGRFDRDLIRKLASTLKRGTILLVGPIWEGLEVLREERRITLLGFRPYHQIPSIINSFHVALIPHKVNRLTNSMDPIKIYEYLALGPPVVSTRVAGVEEFGEVVEIAASSQDFIRRVERVLKRPGLASLRREAVKDHTWEKRILTMQEILRESLYER